MAANTYSCRVIPAKEKVIIGLFSDLDTHHFSLGVSEKEYIFKIGPGHQASVASGLERNVHVAKARVQASPKGVQMQIIKYVSLCMSHTIQPIGCQIPPPIYRVTILSPFPPGHAITRHSPQAFSDRRSS